MKMTELTIKKRDRFLGTEHTERENEFIDKYIYNAVPAIYYFSGVSIDDMLAISNRCHRYDGRVIGVEIHLDSDYPFYVYTWEKYCDIYTSDWLWHVYIDLLSNNITKHIVVVMDFPKNILIEYL